jgi:sugar phosphate isomerase/epimerase
MTLGLSTYAYPWAVGIPGYPPERPLTAFDLLDRAVALGVPAVQFGDNLPLHALSPVDWREVLDTAAQTGLELQVGTRGLTPENLDRYLRLAAEARSPFLRMVIDDGGYQPDEAAVIALVQKYLPKLRETNVVLAIENHDRFPARSLARIVEQTDPAYVGICLDTTNSFGAGEDLHTVVTTLAPYTVNLHAKDFIIRRVGHKMGFTVEGVEPGTGLLDLAWVLDQLRAAGRCRAITLEQWPPFQNSLEKTIQTEAAWAESGIHWIRNHSQP